MNGQGLRDLGVFVKKNESNGFITPFAYIFQLCDDVYGSKASGIGKALLAIKFFDLLSVAPYRLFAAPFISESTSKKRGA